MDNLFKIELTTDRDGTVVQFCGNIDAQAESRLKELPEQVAAPLVRMDFSKAGRINSMGIALLLRCLKNIRENCKAEIEVHGLSQVNNMLFKMTGVYLLAQPVK